MLLRSAASAACAASCSRHLEGLGLVLDLRALVLALHDEAARTVEDLHRAVGRVDALSAWSSGGRDRDLEIFVVDLDVHLVGLGEHGHGRRRGVDAALALGGGHALHAVHAALEAKA
jgi:hypothetical protein